MASTGRPRVVLLLDLDCFYAQCERVRMGLDMESCCLALLQWNSVLAVTYPARGLYRIKRGDSWEAVAQKSKGKCLAVHLPLLTTEQSSTTLQLQEEQNVEQAYDQIFRLAPEEREAIIKAEVGRQRFAKEGKACLERYRLASTRIFAVVLESLERLLGKGRFILERASIDELFFDVTEFCWGDAEQRDDLSEAVNKTTIVGDAVLADNDEAVAKALQMGCWVAHSIRKAVYDELGFTLSAGISTSKLVAKLGASYGKPNGQAVIYPSAIGFVLDETPIHKARNFGGKVGKQVVALLSRRVEATMGNVAKHLSLSQLSKGLGAETAQRAFDNARGIDHEKVKPTYGALIKSITAFKTFFAAPVDSPEVYKWLLLLSTDVCHRVTQDTHRNNRYPRSCTVQYTYSLPGAARVTRQNKSIRIRFPKETEANTTETLAKRAKDAVLEREGNKIQLHGVGVCVMEFEHRAENGGIASFFEHPSSELSDVPAKDDTARSPVATKAATSKATKPADKSSDESMAQRLQKSYDAEARLLSRIQEPVPAPAPVAKAEVAGATPNVAKSAANKAMSKKPADVGSDESMAQRLQKSYNVEARLLSRGGEPANATCEEKDLEVARRLQASYDRENTILSGMERPKQSVSKKMRIDKFFSARTTGK